MSVFGQLVNLHEVSRAVRDFHRKWLDTYLCEIERQAGLTPRVYSREASYIMTNLLTGSIADISPATAIITRGANGTPRRVGSSYELGLDIGIAHMTSSYEGDGAREAAGAFAAATVGMMLQRRSLDHAMNGSLRVVSWDDIRMDDAPERESFTHAVLRLEFTVLVSEVIDPTRGLRFLTDPPPDPTLDPGSWPTVATATTTPTPGGTP